LISLLVAVGLSPLAAGQQEAAASVDYERQVLPILTQHCYGCHGPDDGTRKGDLRLDRRDDALKAIEPGVHVIVPGDPEDSVLMDRITSTDRRSVMPPPKSGEPLTETQVALLRRWIEEGASWSRHWAFRPVGSPAPPAPAASGWGHNEIDRFVAARLAERGLDPAREAHKAALIRRVTVDLTGLPPTPEEVEAFVTDDDPGAYSALVDRLMASPRYGERQAQEWLDLARYADTNGYQRDGSRSNWKWREWVIRAFNANMPFDQFTVEQLAGDLLPEPTLSQRIATGFNRNHASNSEGGAVPDEYRSAYVIDRVNTTATTWLGLTVACAQCHDHKFDPISQKEFYRFYGFFDQVDERDTRQPDLRVPNPDQEPHVELLKARIKELKERLEAPDSLSDAAQARWEERTREFVGEDVEWSAATPVGMLAHNGSVLERQEDGSILATGEAPVRDTYDLVFKPGKRKIAAIRLEVLPDPSQPEGASGRSRQGQFILSGLKMRMSALSDSSDPPLVFVATADADLNQERPRERAPDQIYPGSISGAILASDDKTSSRSRFGRGWSIIGDERMRRHEAILVPLETLSSNSVSTLRVTLIQNARPYKTLMGRFRISFTEDERIRELMLPAVGKIWSAVGPFPAKDSAAAHKTAFEPEKDLKAGMDLKKQYDKPKVVATKERRGGKPGATPASSPGKDAKGTETAPGKPSAVSAAGPGKGPDGDKPGKGDGKNAVAAAPKGSKGKSAKAPAAPVAKPGAKPGAKPAEGSPTSAAAAKPGPGGGSSSSGRRSRRQEKLSWSKKQDWRDGSAGQLADGNVAWYLTRKIHSTRPRTAMMRFDGPAGVKAWLNGELIFEAAPKVSTSSSSSRRGGGGFSRRGRSGSTEREVRVGMRSGENELVVKAVFGQRPSRSRGRRGGTPGAGGAGAMEGEAFNPEDFGGGDFDPDAFDPDGFDAAGFDPGMFSSMRRRRSSGGSFTFDMTVEGEDVVNHEVVTALRQLAAMGEGAADGCEPTDEDDADDREARAEALKKKIRKFYRARHDLVGMTLEAERAKLQRQLDTLERKLPRTLVMKEREKKRQTHVFMRGDFREKGEKVEPGVPSGLPPMSEDLPKNRLGLARWLVSKDNPLTARVVVNRIWQQYFGEGLVSTPEDLGIRSQPPNHPDLLDWLARRFMESGWDLKALHRLVVHSAAYRQDGAVDAARRATDPDNRLLTRGPRQRMSAEMVRDNALAVSGLLQEQVGGESVRPYQPKGLWEAVSRGQRYRKDKGSKQYRRGLYVYWKRGVPYPSALTFDQAKRETCTVQRAETITPLQALVLLNDPVFVECAKMLGQRMLKEGGKVDAERLRFGFRLCASRSPDAAELQVLEKLLADQREHYKKNAAAAAKLLAVGDARCDESLEVPELAAWASVATAMLNLDATIHR